MQVILKQDVEKLGKRGDVVKVSDGYARNYLIPRGLAEEATPDKIKALEEIKRTEEKRAKKMELEAREKAKLLQGKQVVVHVSAGEKGKLFGSVTNAHVSEAISKQLGVEIDKKLIKLEEPIKELGVYPLKIKLHPSVEVEMTLKVEA